MRKSLFEIKRMLDKDLGMEINKVKLLKVLIYRSTDGELIRIPRKRGDCS
jgi:hypothetical protein